MIVPHGTPALIWTIFINYFFLFFTFGRRAKLSLTIIGRCRPCSNQPQARLDLTNGHVRYNPCQIQQGHAPRVHGRDRASPVTSEVRASLDLTMSEGEEEACQTRSSLVVNFTLDLARFDEGEPHPATSETTSGWWGRGRPRLATVRLSLARLGRFTGILTSQKWKTKKKKRKNI